MSTGDADWEAKRRDHHARLLANPLDHDSHHALFDLHRGAGQTDAACSAAQVLTYLKKVSREQALYLEQHRPRRLVRAPGPVPEDVLKRHVAHPDQDPYITAIAALIAPAVAMWRAVERPSSLRAEELVDVDRAPGTVWNLAKYVRDALGVERFDVFRQPNEDGECTLLNVRRENRLRPTLVVFRELLGRSDERGITASLTLTLSSLYLPHYLLVALDCSAQAMKQVLLACLLGVGLPVEGDNAALEQIAREIFGRMHPAARDRLRDVMARFVEAGGSTDVKRWVAAAELTACRLALLLCGDVRAAAEVIEKRQLPLDVSVKWSPKDKIKELVLYSISEDYFAARRAIGVNAQ
jgi:hypothetical protein